MGYVNSLEGISFFFQPKNSSQKSPGQNTNIADDAGDELQEVYVPPQSNLEGFRKKMLHIGLGMVG